MGEMDRFVEEDVIQGVIRGELEAILDPNCAIHACAGAPALAHRAPRHAGWARSDLRSPLGQERIDPFGQDALGWGLGSFLAADLGDHFRDHGALIGLGHAGRDRNHDPPTLAIGREVSFTPFGADHNDLALINSRKSLPCRFTIYREFILHGIKVPALTAQLP